MSIQPIEAQARMQAQAMADVLTERARQDVTWGEQNHDPLKWAAIVAEEVGEFSQAALNFTSLAHPQLQAPIIDWMRQEAVQVAAVGLAIVEYLDRLVEYADSLEEDS